MSKSIRHKVTAPGAVGKGCRIRSIQDREYARWGWTA